VKEEEERIWELISKKKKKKEAFFLETI